MDYRSQIMNKRYFLASVGAVAAFAALSKFTGLPGALQPADQLRNPDKSG